MNGIADIGRGWVHDQLDGTSFIKDALDGIDKEVDDAEKAIDRLVAEEKISSLKDLLSNSKYKSYVPNEDIEAKIKKLQK